MESVVYLDWQEVISMPSLLPKHQILLSRLYFKSFASLFFGCTQPLNNSRVFGVKLCFFHFNDSNFGTSVLIYPYSTFQPKTNNWPSLILLQILVPLSTTDTHIEENHQLPDYLPEDESPEKELDRAVSRTAAKQDASGSWLSSAASFLTKTFYWWSFGL